MRRLLAVVVAALVAVTTLAACSDSDAPGPSSSNPNVTPGDVRIIYPKAAFTAKTLSDWKSLGDAIVIAEVTSSKVDTSTASDPEYTGGIYGRIVTISVLNTLWSRDAAHVPPSTFDMNAWGWVQRGNVKQAIVARGEPRLETNHVYLLVLAKFAKGWSGLGDGAEVPVDGGTVGVGEWAGRLDDDDQPAIDALMGKNVAQVAAIIDATQPDPRSVQYGNLDPLARAKKLGKASG